MGIDHHYYISAGMRESRKRRFDDCRDREAIEILTKHGVPKHQVFLAHGGSEAACYLIDEQFYFEDPEDARWFFREGYKRMLFSDEVAIDRMALWIDGKEAGKRTTKITIRKRASKRTNPNPKPRPKRKTCHFKELGRVGGNLPEVSAGPSAESTKEKFMTDLGYMKEFDDSLTQFNPTKRDLVVLAHALAENLISYNHEFRLCVGRSRLNRRDYVSFRLARIVEYLPELEPEIHERIRRGHEENNELERLYVEALEAEAQQHGETTTPSE
jgi:hypothetical protein